MNHDIIFTKELLKSILYEYVKINDVSEILSDLENIRNLKREITKIYKRNKYNLLLARNIFITIINTFPNHYKKIVYHKIDTSHHIILNTLLYSINPNINLITIDNELLKEIKYEYKKRK